MQLLNILPPVYRHILPPFFQDDVPPEKLATCDHCIMLPVAHGLEQPEIEFYSPATKCCTYFPRIPNYLVGYILDAQNHDFTDGREILRGLITRRCGIRPEGIGPDKLYRLLYRHGRKKSFGRSRRLRCPFFREEGGNCTIWQGRSAVCSTWFCRFNNGEEGRDFWNAVKDYLQFVETTLAEHCLSRLGFPCRVVEKEKTMGGLSPGELDGYVDDQQYRKRWSGWSSGEEELYTESYRIVRRMTFMELGGLLGYRGEQYVGGMVDARRIMLRPELPDPLRLNPQLFRVEGDDGTLFLVTATGSFRLLPVIAKALTLFNGLRSLEQVNSLLAERERARLSETLVNKLYQHRILCRVDE